MVCVYVYSDYMGVIMMLEVVVDEIEVGVFFLVGMIIDQAGRVVEEIIVFMQCMFDIYDLYEVVEGVKMNVCG